MSATKRMALLLIVACIVILSTTLTTLSMSRTGYAQENAVGQPSPTTAKDTEPPASRKGYSIQRIRTEPLPERVRVRPTLDGHIVAVVTREQTSFYYLDDNTCSGPDTIEKGESSSQEAMMSARREEKNVDVFPQWQKNDAGEDVFILDIGGKTGLRRSSSKWVDTSTTKPLNKWKRAPRNHQHRKTGPNASSCLLEPILATEDTFFRASPREPMQYRINVRVKRIDDGGEKQSEDAEDKNVLTIKAVWSVHPEYDIAIVSTNEYPYFPDGNSVYLNLNTGVAKELTSNRGLTGTRGTSHARFSPDYRWILYTINHDHLSHEGGGYLQLFDLNGDFVEELAVFPTDVFTPAGRAHWLPNDWIVYDDRKEIHFLKYTSE